MFRRSFLGLPFIGLLPLAKTKAKSIPIYQSEFGLGNYQSHFVGCKGMADCNMNANSSYNIRYVSFPIECELEIKYEKGTEVYKAFNLPKDLIKQINQMSIEKLMTFQKESNLNNKYTIQLIFDKHYISLNHVWYK